MTITSKTIWARVCQSCGHYQKDTQPQFGSSITNAYQDRKCRKCGSRDFDYGHSGFFELSTGQILLIPIPEEE